MNERLARAVPWLPLLAGVLYIVLWWVAEAGRFATGLLGTVAGVAPLVAIGVAIASCWSVPWLAILAGAAAIIPGAFIPALAFDPESWPMLVPLLVVVAILAARGRAWVRWTTLVLGIIGAGALGVALSRAASDPLVSLILIPDGGQPAPTRALSFESHVAEAVSAGLLLAAAVVVAWYFGIATRTALHARAARARSERLARELAVAETELESLSTRDRLATDVHDVMAHSLAVIAAQADGARLSKADADGTASTLTTIADTAREGLTELRGLLDAAPEGPDLAELPELVGRISSAGHRTTIESFGSPAPLSPLQQLCAYRIIQESLTNALRHVGSEGSTRVVLDWRGTGLSIAVTTDGVQESGVSPGRGVRGMHERARLAGGWLSAELDEGTYVVSAFMPTLAPAVSA